jgi:thiamine pyrophosphokinase
MKVVVVAHGELDPRDREHLRGHDLLVAADGGALHLDALGVRPDVLIGDLDSVPAAMVERLAAAGTRVERRSPDKDESDTELAVLLASDAGGTEVVVLAALGGRLDHELANVLMVADPAWRGIDLRIRRGGTLVRPLHGEATLQLDAEAGDVVTLLPIGGDAEAVRTTGLRYTLNGERLRFGRSRGLSNEVERAPASVSLETGTLLVVETREE